MPSARPAASRRGVAAYSSLQIGRGGLLQHCRRNAAALQQHPVQKVRPFSQPVGPHGAAQVHAVDAGAEIVRQGGAVHRIRQPGQFPEAGAVQHKIALLTVAGLRQSLTGLLYGLCRLGGEEVPQLPLPVVRQQLLRIPPASCHQQAAAVLAPALYQYLQIVIVRGQPENVQDPCIGHILAQTGEQLLPPPANGLIQRRLRLRVKGGPAHLLQHTGRIPVRRSRQQLLPAPWVSSRVSQLWIQALRYRYSVS